MDKVVKVAWQKWHGKSGMAKVAWQKWHDKSCMAKVAWQKWQILVLFATATLSIFES